MQRRSSSGILIIAAALLVAGAAGAQNPAAGGGRAQDIENGKRIAQMWCSNCHLVDPQKRKANTDAVPTFASIAQAPSTTEMSLAAFLTNPHGDMPDLILSRTEIQNISAYILSLRQKP